MLRSTEEQDKIPTIFNRPGTYLKVDSPMNKKKHTQQRRTYTASHTYTHADTRSHNKNKPNNKNPNEKAAYADNEGKPKRSQCTHSRVLHVVSSDGLFFCWPIARVKESCFESFLSGSDDRLARFLSYTNIFMTEKRVICVQMIETHWSPRILDDAAVLFFLFFSSSFSFCIFFLCFHSCCFCFGSLVSNRILVLRLDISLSLPLFHRIHTCQRVKSVVVFCSSARMEYT